MHDVFISYASADRPRAALLAHALQARGWSVWWDRTIPPGRQFDQVIEEALEASRCVVVLWSADSVASDWVKTEAAEANRRRALIPALIDEKVRIPLEFRRLQAADLSRWQGEPQAPEFEQFCAAIARELAEDDPPTPRPPRPAPRPVPPPPPGPTPDPTPGPTPVPDDAAKRSRSKVILVAIAAVLGVLIVAGALTDGNNGGDPAPDPMPSPLPGPAPIVPVAAPGVQAVQWRDHMFSYSGSVAWDGRSSTAQISAGVLDPATGRTLPAQSLMASATPGAPGQIVFSTRIDVPADRETTVPHSHDVNLVFQQQANGTWLFRQNCLTPIRCF